MSASNNPYFELVKQNVFFQGLNDSQLERVVALSKTIKFKENLFILKEGSVSDDFYLIVEGEVEVTKKDPEKNILYQLAKLKKNDLIGEMGFITKKNRNASIHTLTDVTLLAFSIEKFNTAENADIFSILKNNLADNLISRLENSYQVVADSMRQELIKSKKLKMYQFITILIMAIFVFQLGLAVHYLTSSSGLCGDLNKIRQQKMPAIYYAPR